MSEQQKREDPQFTTDSVDDLAALLGRAANWAERDCAADVIAAELRDGQEFVEVELQADEPELATDGGTETFDPADYDSVREALREAPAGYGVESVIDYFDPVSEGGHEVDVDV
ncbi:hypothetical protein EXE44_17715 [Halorubrum sp. SS7]|uniref:hypothetical protein n=1 Tax=unclassified Halorubrum TaxID=2642239 RepID=UPI0010F72287|nr:MULTISPECIES: hypothetical protein [unclassified Halorubrum]TKX52896.1 hypothetical protein EXE44_17715 [Halorubrum sp. SS7]TKX54858.1 hypothetical protein EXE42_07020 [Halorubrum sp. SP3]